MALLGPRVLFGIGSSVLQFRWCGLSRSLQRVSVFQCGDLGQERGYPFSYQSLLCQHGRVSGSMCCIRPGRVRGVVSLI